jgi:hypothetical protein
MLNNSQVKFLSEMCNLNIHKYGDVVISVNDRSNKNKVIKHNYEDFKNNMGLDDIRFHWLLSNKTYISGGSALNWIWGEHKNEDFDFFFINNETAQNFKMLIANYGFEETCESKYALTFFNREEKIILQIIGSQGKGKPDEKFNGFIPFGTPEETIQRFDINVCRFAVDGEFVYTTVGAVLDLINRVVKITEEKYNTKERITKYNQKGFFLPNPEAQPKEDTSGWY